MLAKNIFYQKIDLALKQLTCLQPAVYNNVPRTTTDAGVVSANHRDAVVSNLRLLNIFCNNSPVTFARAVSLLDRLLGQVKVGKLLQSGSQFFLQTLRCALLSEVRTLQSSYIPTLYIPTFFNMFLL